MDERPNFEGIYGSTANPVRLIYMIGAVWRLAEDGRRGHLDILEVGSWAGSSALAWGEAIGLYCGGRGTLTCVDSWEPYLDMAVNADEANRMMHEALADDEAYRVFRANMRFLPPGVALDVRRGRSQDVLATLPHAAFDLVYIDGGHTYDVVASDIANVLPLVRDGGILCGDDLELQAHECDTSEVERQPLLERATDPASGMSFHPGVTRAVGERFGRVSAWYGFWAMRRRGAGWEPISLDGMPARIPSHIPPRSLIGLKAVLMKHGIL